MIRANKKLMGFTLLEMVLVMAIMASVLVAILGYTTQKSDEARRDRLVMQIQQILNAGLAYYVNLSAWPANFNGLQTNHYLPTGTFNNPWGSIFSTGVDTTNNANTFNVCTSLPGTAWTAANIVAGRLPFGLAWDGTTAPATTCPPTATFKACTNKSTTCTVVANVNIPGQSLSNARSINFAGVYHNGACVPEPSCPSGMTSEIVTVPVSVVGTPDMVNAYPISSFTATISGSPPTTNPPVCPGSTSSDTNCYQTSTSPGNNITPYTTGNYWRVCLKILAGQGTVTYSSSNMNAGIILALTRCTPSAEPAGAAGSDFTVFMP